jgi:hypothetical protein
VEDFWTQRHLSDAELHRWLEAALAAASAAPVRDQLVAHYLLSVGNGVLGKDEAQLLHARHMLAAAELLGDPVGLGYAQLALAFAWDDRGDIDRAAAAYAAAIPLWRAATDDERWALFAQAELGDKRILQGDLETGVQLLEEALTRLRQLANPPWSIVNMINRRGYAALRQGDLALAAQVFTEAVTRARDLRHMDALLGAMAGMAGLALAHGQPELAARLLGAVEAGQELVGMRRIQNSLHIQRIAADARAALPAAAFDQAWWAGRAVPQEEAIAEALTIADEVANGAAG